MRHEDLWRALDTLAAEHGLTPSGLARAAGLDATAFNRSKRRGADGRPRWPSTESLSRALLATGASLQSFSALVAGGRALGSGGSANGGVPLPVFVLGGDGASLADRFDPDGAPTGRGWQKRFAPAPAIPGDYGLAIETEAFAPAFCAGDLVVVSPDAPVGDGDRVIARVEARIGPALLSGRSASSVTLLPLSGGAATPFGLTAVHWMHRVSWIGR